MSEQIGGPILTDRGLWKWVNDSGMHRMFTYFVILATVSLIVQIVATVFIGRL